MSLTDDSWHPGNYAPPGCKVPAYKTMPDSLRVEDVWAPKLENQPRYLWAGARNRALARWPVPWVLRERDTGYRRQRVTLNVEKIDPGIGGWAGYMLDPNPPHDPVYSPKGMAWVHVDADEWRFTRLSRNTYNLTYIITHELGHVLGFGHGGDGVMAVPRTGVISPNAEELALVRDFWGLP